MTATGYWIEKFGERPQTDTEKLAVVMMREYADLSISKMVELKHNLSEALAEKDAEIERLKNELFIMSYRGAK